LPNIFAWRVRDLFLTVLIAVSSVSLLPLSSAPTAPSPFTNPLLFLCVLKQVYERLGGRGRNRRKAPGHHEFGGVTPQDRVFCPTPRNGTFQGLSAYFGLVRLPSIMANDKADSDHMTIDF